MEMEEMEPKRPRLLWITVVAVVAVVVALFIVIQSGRMKSRMGQGEREARRQAESAAPGEAAWPAPEEAEREVSVAEVAVEEETEPEAAVSRPEEVPPPPLKAAPRKEPSPKKPAEVSVSRKGQPLVLPTSELGRFVVQVGSYQDERIARIQAERVERLGYKAWIEPADLPGKGRYYRVRIGGFEIYSDAERVAASMERIFQDDCWVDNR